MIHRHLEYPAGTPPEQLSSAALVDILDRGDLSDWQPLAAAITRNPQGELAGRLAKLMDTYPMYGTSPLWRAFLERRTAATLPAFDLSEIRRSRKVTQADLARRIGISQSDVSKLERRGDLRLSSLLRYVKALGGRLRLLIDFPDGEVEVSLACRKGRKAES